MEKNNKNQLLTLLAVALLVGIVSYNYGFMNGKKAGTICDIVNVKIFDLAFEPKTLTVHPCDKVVWTNSDQGVTHSIKAIEGSSEDYSKVLSGELNYKDTFEYTFAKPGKMVYTSKANDVLMQGTIEVK